MKIGIITEISLNTVNYGNNLQAFALNRYLLSYYSGWEIETILMQERTDRKITSVYFYLKRKIAGCFMKVKHLFLDTEENQKNVLRFQKFRDFAQNYIVMNTKMMTRAKLMKSDYDIFIVGSDVVWYQWRGFINRVKYLDFNNKKKADKIAYAASFGNDHIPRENIRIIKKNLSDFKMISVREKVSIALLQSIGIKNVIHTCDPVLLLSKEEWEKLELFPTNKIIGCNENLKDQKFCFAYLLGKDNKQREKIQYLCKREKLKLVTIPYVLGYTGDGTDCFGDIQIQYCGPQEWLWLVHHACYMVTDSFHGLVFSTIFSTDFLIIERKSTEDMNIRLIDYLSTIKSSDKMVDIEMVDKFSDFQWDHEGTIKEQIEQLRKQSIGFLRQALEK